MRKCFPKLLSRWQLPLSNSSQTKLTSKSIIAPLCCGNCVFFSISKTSWCGLPWWRSHQLSCNFSKRQHCALTRCPLHFWVALIWHFDRCRMRLLAGCLNSLFWRVVELLVFTDVARLNWPFAWWFLSNFLASFYWDNFRVDCGCIRLAWIAPINWRLLLCCCLS